MEISPLSASTEKRADEVTNAGGAAVAFWPLGFAGGPLARGVATGGVDASTFISIVTPQGLLCPEWIFILSQPRNPFPGLWWGGSHPSITYHRHRMRISYK